jgi:hypothetical protein
LGLKIDSTHFQTKSFKFLQISHLDFWSVTHKDRRPSSCARLLCRPSHQSCNPPAAAGPLRRCVAPRQKQEEDVGCWKMWVVAAIRDGGGRGLGE